MIIPKNIKNYPNNAKIICISIFNFDEIPEELLCLIFYNHQALQVIQKILPYIQNKILIFDNHQHNTDINKPVKIITPPIVGVLFFL